MRIALDLPIGNPLTAPSGRGPDAEAKKREHGREEAEFAAARLTELLAEARSEPTRYRE